MKTLTARIKGDKIEIFDAISGGIQRTHSLPPGKYTGLAIAGNVVSITIQTPYSGDRIRTINMLTGAIVSDLGM